MSTLGSITITGQTEKAGGANDFQTEFFTVSNPPQSQFVLSRQVAIDTDGDPILKIYYNGMILEIDNDYTLLEKTVTWTSSISLETGEKVEIFYQPIFE